MAKSKYKRSTAIYARVPADFKEELKGALEAINFTESYFLRAVAEALVHQVAAGEDLALPLRLLTVPEKRRPKKPG